MALDATVGGASANTYATQVEADAYFAARFGSDSWTALLAADKEKALKQAARELDRHRFLGRKAYYNQALEFPRQYPYHSDDPESTTAVEVPDSVKHAQCEQALWVVENSATGGRSSRQALQAEGVTSFRVGSTSETFGGGAILGILCPEARHLLSRWTSRWGRIQVDDRGDL